MTPCCTPLPTRAWVSADFFPGEGKNFPGRGVQEPTFALKQQKRYYFSPKSLKTYYFWPALAGQGEGQEPPLPSPADAHAPESHVLFEWPFSLNQIANNVFNIKFSQNLKKH